MRRRCVALQARACLIKILFNGDQPGGANLF
jgi:hypothetical protein